MVRPLNLHGSLEVEENLMKYRLKTRFLKGSESTDDIERNLKRKLQEFDDDSYYLKPSNIQAVGSAMVFFYQLDGYKAFMYLRELDLEDKLEYYKSLITLARNETKARVLWDMWNFYVDEYSKKMCAIVFETDDMPVFAEERDSLDEIKDLIILSLTNLDQVIGKPSRANFLEKNDKVIEFAETIIHKVDSLEDLEDYIETVQIEFLRDEVPELAQDSLKEEKKKVKFSFKTNKTDSVKESTKIKKPQNKKKKTQKSQDGKKKKSNTRFLVLCGLTLVGVLLLAQFLNSANASTAESSKEEEKTIAEQIAISGNAPGKTDEKYNDDLLSAYRYSMNNDTEKAISKLESIGYENLSEEDRNIMINIYVKAKMYAKAIELDSSKSQKIVNDVIISDTEMGVKKVQKELSKPNPYVDFEVAYSNQDWEKVIDLKDKVERNGRKEEQIAMAYVNLDKIDEAVEFAESVGNPELIETVNSYKEDKELQEQEIVDEEISDTIE